MINHGSFTLKWTQPYHGWTPMKLPIENLGTMAEAKQIIEAIKNKARNSDAN